MEKEDIERQEIETWLAARPGYLKKSALVTRVAMFAQFVKDFDENLIKECQKKLRASKILTKEEDTFDELLEGGHTSVPVTAPEPKKLKKLFFDIETSANICYSWSIGNKIRLTPENIIKERAIICICYKWAHEDKIHSIEWNKGDDKNVILEFSKILEQADEIIGHNSDNFDIKHIYSRAIKHDIKIKNTFKKVDTLKIARKLFKFNSNKLNYLGQFLNVGSKINTTYDLWIKITMDNDIKAMEEMVKYCKMDVEVLEKVYNRLINYDTRKSMYKM